MIIFTSCSLISVVYTSTLLLAVSPEILNNAKTCASETLNAETVFNFWHENADDCQADVRNLYKIHKKILLYTGKQKNDSISVLLHGHLTSALFETLFTQLMAAFSTKSSIIEPVMEKVLNQLYEEQDKSFVIKIWQKVFDELSLFMSGDDILQQIVLLTNGDLKLNLLELMLTKYEREFKINNKFLPLLTFGVTSVLKQRQQSQAAVGDPRIGRLLSKLPEQLLTIFQSWNYNVSILNSHHNEYAFSERDAVVEPNKRYLFNFLPAKNPFRVKGKFKLQFNPRGLFKLGAFYDTNYKYLRAENRSAFICLDCVMDESEWWQVLWPYNDTTPVDPQFVLFQNVLNNELLCSVNMFNDHLVSISTLDLAQHMHDSQCLWKVVKRNK